MGHEQQLILLFHVVYVRIRFPPSGPVRSDVPT